MKKEEINWEELKKWDVIEKLMPLLAEKGWYVDYKTGKITCGVVFSYAGPWVTVQRSNSRKCGIWHRVLFDHLDFIPKMCLNCWKVVARPQTVEQLIGCYEVMKSIGHPSKCGTEPRPTVHGLYGCYFYCDSLEEGKKIKEIVVKRFHEEVSPDIKVILKRYCTEFEHKFGPSNKYEYTEDCAKWEKIISEVLEFPEQGVDQPEFIKEHVIKLWLEEAYSKGDNTALKFNNGKLFYPALVEY